MNGHSLLAFPLLISASKSVGSWGSGLEPAHVYFEAIHFKLLVAVDARIQIPHPEGEVQEQTKC